MLGSIRGGGELNDVPLLICEDCFRFYLDGDSDNPNYSGPLPWTGEYTISLTDNEEETFGRGPCDTCGTPLGGLRFYAVGIPSV